MGKTEFLTKDLTPAAEKKGYTVGYCNLWQEDQDPAAAIEEAITACSTPQHVIAKVRAKLETPVSTLLGFNDTEEKSAIKLRSAFTAFDKSKNTGLLLIDEAQILADRKHASLEVALRALLDTRKDRLKVIITGSSEDRLRIMFGAEDKALYNWARVEPLPLLDEEFVRELTRRANALTTMKLQLADTLRAFEALKGVPELFRRFLSQYLGNAFEGVDHVLRRVALGGSDLHGSKSLAKIGHALELGHPADRSVPQNSLRRLRERQILIQSDKGIYRFEDEAFQEWVLSEHPEV